MWWVYLALALRVGLSSHSDMRIRTWKGDGGWKDGIHEGGGNSQWKVCNHSMSSVRLDVNLPQISAFYSTV